MLMSSEPIMLPSIMSNPSVTAEDLADLLQESVDDFIYVHDNSGLYVKYDELVKIIYEYLSSRL